MPKIVAQDMSLAKRITCRNCGGVNEYMPHEVRVLYQGKDISGSTEVTKGFNCAQCGSEVVTESW